MSDKKRLMIRLALSVMFGICVMMVPLWLVVGGSGGFYITYLQSDTQQKLRKLDQRILDYRVQHGQYPARLEDLAWRSKDGWNRPFLYSLSDGKPITQSLGRDGVRGGVGLDADLSNRSPQPPESAVPFWQKVTNPVTLRISIAVLICGVLAGALFFNDMANQSVERKSWRGLGVTFLVTLCLAGFGAAIITLAHVPSGH